MTRAERHKAIVKRRIFIAVCVCILAALILLIAFVKSAFGGKKTDGLDVSQGSSSAAGEIVSDVSSEDPTPSYPATGPNGLDANYEQLLLVNAQNPLPENYDYEGSLTEIPSKYINGMLKQIDKNVWPYMQAMIDAQRATRRTGFMSVRRTVRIRPKKCFSIKKPKSGLQRGFQARQRKQRRQR